MGTISDKLTYLNDTKTLLRRGINALGGGLTTDDTFRSYANALDNIYDYLPKVTGTGTSVTLDGVRDGGLRINLNPTAISQDGTPTPDNPQDIHTISGDNNIKVEGKNLLNTSYLVEANADKTYKGYGFWAFKLTNELGTYTLSRANNTMYADGKYLVIGQGSDLASAFDNKVWLMHPTLSNLNAQYRTLTNTGELWLFTGSSQVNINDMLNYSGYLQLEKGSTATTYTPYVSQTNPINLGEYELGTIGNYSNEFVRSGGEQLFDKDNVVSVDNKILNDSGVETNDSGGGYTKMYIPVEPSTQYTISGLPSSGTKRIYYFNNSKTFISRTSGFGTTSTTITTPSNCYYLDIQYVTSGNDFNTYMVCKGTSTDYVPYEKGWYYKQGIGKVVLDGSESHSRAGTGRFILTTPNIALEEWSLTTPILTKSNYFIGARWIEIYRNLVDNAISSHVSAHQIVIQTSLFDDIASFKSWLSIHNTIVYYVLATPTYTKITGELAEQLEQVYKGMLSYDGTTNISQVNNDLAFELVGSAITK